ncbi:MAG: DUF4340 domain-containing protein [Ruminococcus sp.]|nr:DUF4340 domain-containing protein [Ruminococcus sp.]
MAENKENLNAQGAFEITEAENATENNGNDALKSFLERDTSDKAEKKNESKKEKKLSKNALWIIIAAAVVLVIFAVVMLLNFIPQKNEPADIDFGTDVTLQVDENGEHQANLVLNEKGKLDNNSYGTLLSYTPSDIAKIDVKNQSGSFTILAQTPVSIDEETGEETTDSTIYTLVGFEDISLLGGGPDTIANDVAKLDFISVADITGKKASDYGFDSPRATVKTTFTDGTSATIILGNQAPSNLGEYVMFGDSKTVYVVATDSVDGLLFSVLDLVDLTVNDSAADTASSELESVTLSGTAYGDTIEIRPNEDRAIDSSYVMISPKKMFISEVEAANISGAIRGLYAQQAVCVNPSSAQLSEYGLSTPYAQISAIYPDTTVNIKASKPDDDSVYIIADSNIIYKIEASSVPWVYTTFDKLRPDVVINPNFSSISEIVVTDSSGTYDFDVKTVSETVDTTDGATETVDVTTATYNGKTLDEDNFYTFYQNLCNMQNAGNNVSAPSGKPAITIKISYSTGRTTDTVEIYSTGNTKYIAKLNGETLCLVYKSYCTKFENAVQDLINGKTVSSF